MMIELDLIQGDTPPERPERRDAAENRQLILETAVRLFNEHGVANVCMAEIAKEAGIGKGTLYRRFANKGELCLSLLDNKFKEFQNQQLNLMQEQFRVQLTPIDQLVSFLKHLTLFTIDHLDLLVEIENANVPNTAGDINTPHWWNDITVRKLLQNAMDLGQIPSNLDVAYTASALLAALDSRILRSQLNAGRFTLSQITTGLEAVVQALQCK